MAAFDDKRARRNVAVLVLAQAILGSQLPMIFTVGGLAGQSLASNPCWATLPISLIVFGSMTTAPWLSQIMQRFGRRTGFLIGAAGGCAGGLLGAYALSIASFPLFLAGSYLTGIFMSANGFLRFAAADAASDSFRPKAVSYVMAAGLASAVIGPNLVKVTADEFVVPFLGTYLGIVGLNLFGAILFAFLKLPRPDTSNVENEPVRSYGELIRAPKIAVAIICAMVSYALMNLVMTSTPLAVVGCGFSKSNAADIVSSHVVAMFAPSFFTGHLIARFGSERIVAIGLLLLAGAGLSGLAGTELTNFFLGLVLLGIGWNFGFIGATSLLLTAHNASERGKVQGMNDAIVFGCVTIASLASGTLMNCSGATAVDGWTSVNYAMIPFLAIAGSALTWLMLTMPSGKAHPG